MRIRSLKKKGLTSLTGNKVWRTEEESSFLNTQKIEMKTPIKKKRLALYLEVLFLSDKLHVDHLFYGCKNRGFTLLRKYLRRVLDLGVILGCLHHGPPPRAQGTPSTLAGLS